jgi:hypothetical protein
MVIATPLYFEWIYLAFKSNASLGSGHFKCSSHSFSESFSGLIIENGTFSQTTGAIWAWLWTICGSILYCFVFLKKKCFKGLNTLFFKNKA